MTSLSKDESENYAEAGGVAEEVLSSVRTVVAFGGQEKEVRCERRIEPMQTIKSLNYRVVQLCLEKFVSSHYDFILR